MKTGVTAKRKKTAWPTDCLRLEPDKRLCPQVDDVSIRTFPLPTQEEMGVRVLDDFCQEHIM
jgi:hypothetical protein